MIGPLSCFVSNHIHSGIPYKNWVRVVTVSLTMKYEEPQREQDHGYAKVSQSNRGEENMLHLAQQHNYALPLLEQ